jgi:hypothetical protein
MDGVDRRFAVVGLWGSGNVVAPRDELYSESGDFTAYTMWDGHALYGPGRPGGLEKAPFLTAVLMFDEFVERYASLGDRCEVWTGDEALGLGCDAACANLTEVCPYKAFDCAADCPLLPAEIVECLAATDGCVVNSGCGVLEWFATTTTTSETP